MMFKKNFGSKNFQPGKKLSENFSSPAALGLLHTLGHLYMTLHTPRGTPLPYGGTYTPTLPTYILTYVPTHLHTQPGRLVCG